MPGFTKEYPYGNEGCAAHFFEHDSGLMLKIAKVHEGRRPNWKSLSWDEGFWIINHDEAEQILGFLSGGNPSLLLRASRSYYPDAPANPRDFVGVRRLENGDVSFSIGNYSFTFLAREMPEIIAELQKI